MEIIFNTKVNPNLKLYYYRENIFTKIIYIFILLITFGLFEFYFKHYQYIFYSLTDLNYATYVKIYNKKKKDVIFTKLHKSNLRLVPKEKLKFLIYFFYKFRIYYYSNKKSSFVLLRNKMIKSINDNPKILDDLHKGIPFSQKEQLLLVYGKNLIEVPKLHVPLLLIEEILCPSTIYEIFCCILWNLDGYPIYGDIVLILSTIAIITSVYSKIKHCRKTRKMAYHEELVSVKRNSEFVEISSMNVTIGDIIKINPSKLVPCDILLLKGKCICKEAMLTGETEPIIKSPFCEDEDIRKNNIILAGSHCLSSKFEKDKALGVVVNTGFYTFKGELVRSILLGESEEFEFNTDLFYFFFTLVIITSFGFVFYLQHFLDYSLVDQKTMTIIYRGFEFFATAIPPTLPLCLTIGLEIVMERLSKYGIHTLITANINEAGRVKIMCFDKTGTLTENGLFFKGIIAKTNESPPSLSDLKIDIKEINSLSFCENRINEIMGCCHSLSYLEEKLVGDPLEYQMFTNSLFEMFEDELGKNFYIPPKYMPTKKYELIKKIEFTPERKRFTCVMKIVEENRYLLFTKGAPDIIIKHCEKSSLSFDIYEKLKVYSQAGYRVLAMASKNLEESDLKIKEKELEKNLIFEGFICFENPLKPVTKGVIKTLKNAKIKNIMITGDNLITSLSVGYNCGIVEKNDNVWSGKIENGELKWSRMNKEVQRIKSLSSIESEEDLLNVNFDEENRQFDNFEYVNEEIYLNDDDNNFNALIRNCCIRNTKIVLTGDAFEFLLNSNKNPKHLQILFKNTLVYGRANPGQKALIVKTLMKILKNKKHQSFVGFCGDGANDCPALKTANIGLSLSNFEASIAAPFTSTVTDISNVPILIKEGKASLQIGLQNFKYILCFSLFQFYGMVFNFTFSIDFTNWQYYVIDLMLYFPVTFFSCLTLSNENLVKEYPFANLINFRILLSIIGNNILCFVGNLLLYFYIISTPTYLEIYHNNFDLFEQNENNYFFVECYYFFLFNLLIAIFTSISFNRGYPFLKHWYENTLLTGHLILIFIFLIILLCSNMFGFWISYFIDTSVRKLEFFYSDILFVIFFSAFWTLLMFVFEIYFVDISYQFYKKRKRRL